MKNKFIAVTTLVLAFFISFIAPALAATYTVTFNGTSFSQSVVSNVKGGTSATADRVNLSNQAATSQNFTIKDVNRNTTTPFSVAKNTTQPFWFDPEVNTYIITNVATGTTLTIHTIIPPTSTPVPTATATPIPATIKPTSTTKPTNVITSTKPMETTVIINSTTTVATTTDTISTAPVTESPTNTIEPTPVKVAKNESGSVVLISGIIGGLLLLVTGGLIIFFLVYKRKKQNTEKTI